MLKLKTLLQQHSLTQAALARELGVSEATLAQIINHNQWPKRDTHDLKSGIERWLGERGVNARDCFDTIASRKNNPTVLNEEERMLLKKQVLLPATKKHFGLFRAPFDDNAVQSHEDVFMTPDNRYVREALCQHEFRTGI